MTQQTAELYGTVALAAAAVSIFTYSLVRQMQRLGQEKAETLGQSQATANTIEHFIPKARLLQVRITATVTTAGVLAAALWLVLDNMPWVIAGVSAGAALFAWFVPVLYFRRKVKARAEAFRLQMLDLSLGLTNGLKAGQALQQAIEVLSRNSADPMREELLALLREHQLGLALPAALGRLYERIPCEDLLLLSTSVSLTMKSGGSLADVLAKITELIRRRMDFQRQLSALTAQGRFEALAMSLAPVAAFIILFIVERDLMIPLVTTGIGWCAIGAVVLLETCGYLIIRKIVDIEI